MKQYLEALDLIMTRGVEVDNRTGTRSRRIEGHMMKFDLSQGHPAVTTKRLFWKNGLAEQLGFLLGYDNAAKFRELGCKFWDKDANENQQWLFSPFRKGEDDLGRIYGVQWRHWRGVPLGIPRSALHPGQGNEMLVLDADDVRYEEVDQFKNVINDLICASESRRIIMSGWRPDELDQMALPPCHVLYRFSTGYDGQSVNLTMYQRSCDMFLGVPINISNSAFMLTLVAHMVGKRPGIFTHFLDDVHIYENHYEQVKTMLAREPKALPTLSWELPEPSDQNRFVGYSSEDINKYLIQVVQTPVSMIGYDPHDAISGELSVGQAK